MKERPILFSGPMVKAIREGRKTQTRRVVKPSWIAAADAAGESWGPEGDQNYWAGVCPYGQPGDRLWVRETHRFDGLDPRIAIRDRRLDEISYRADMISDSCCDSCTWRPSIFMPRWASRITLEVAGVRVERLNEISEADAKAEGIEDVGDLWRNYTPDSHYLHCLTLEQPRDSFRSLWESINGPGSWDLNPFVWVVEFGRVSP